MENEAIRVPDYSHIPCRACNRKYLKADAHWYCAKCRKTDERAQCSENCTACVAMEEEEWRKKAYTVNEIKKSYKKPIGPSTYLFTGKKKGKYGSPLKRKKVANKLKVALSLVPRSSKAAPKPKSKPVNPYSKRLKQFETFIYNPLKPTIPNSLVENGFTLPEIPAGLKAKFEISKSELIRLLASSSICYHLSKNRSQFCDEQNQLFNASSDGIVSLFASLIKFKANTLGKIIFAIRKSLLTGVVSASPKVVSQLIYGPINPTESFFGNIDALKKAVNDDKSNVLRRPSVKTSLPKEDSGTDDFEMEEEFCGEESEVLSE